jgi:hypothetical protein
MIERTNANRSKVKRDLFEDAINPLIMSQQVHFTKHDTVATRLQWKESGRFSDHFLEAFSNKARISAAPAPAVLG